MDQQNLQESSRILKILTRVKQAADGIVTHMKKTLHPARPLRNWISLMLCVTSVFIDPLFFYIPVIKVDIYCLDLDKKLGVIACVFRTVVDLFYIIDVLHDSSHYNSPYIDLLAVLPLPQVVIIIIVSKTSLNFFGEAMNALKYVVLFQFVPRVIRIHPLLKKATSSCTLTGVTWVKAAFNLYLYVISGHVFGALWYFFAIEREIEWWKNELLVYNNQYRCNPRSFNSHENSGNYRFAHINDCSTKYKKVFGIFCEALQSGVVEGSFLHKFIYCFRWGLQSLSCFAQNLTTSMDIGENIFTILITISSLVLFIFLLGNIQLYLQIETIRSEEKKLSVREIDEWPSFRKLSKETRHQVSNHLRRVWLETKGVDANDCLNKLPNELRRAIKKDFCLKEIENVPKFQEFLKKPRLLHALYDRLNQVLYVKDRCIFQEGDPITQMLFIIRGELTVNGQSDDPSIRIYGKELLTSDQPIISDRTVKAKSAVEAFALKADDLKSLTTQFKRTPLHNGGRSEEENKSQHQIVEETVGSSTSLGATTANGNRVKKRTTSQQKNNEKMENIPDTDAEIPKPVEPDFTDKENKVL